MQIRAVVPEDLKQLNAWYKSYGQSQVLCTSAPTGFIVDGVAACFLIKTDCQPLAWVMDGLIANKHATRAERAEALKMIYAEMQRVAREAGVKRLIGWFLNETVAKRMATLGLDRIGVCGLYGCQL